MANAIGASSSRSLRACRVRDVWRSIVRGVVDAVVIVWVWLVESGFRDETTSRSACKAGGVQLASHVRMHGEGIMPAYMSRKTEGARRTWWRDHGLSCGPNFAALRSCLCSLGEHPFQRPLKCAEGLALLGCQRLLRQQRDKLPEGLCNMDRGCLRCVRRIPAAIVLIRTDACHGFQHLLLNEIPVLRGVLFAHPFAKEAQSIVEIASQPGEVARTLVGWQSRKSAKKAR